jgi:ATP-dependent exoDNAse (exonuclease V) beta subunit
MGLPYQVVGGISVYQRKEIKDIIAYARLILNHGDNVSLRRVINCPPRGIGAATLSKIENEAKKKSVCLYDTLKACMRNNGIVVSTREKISRRCLRSWGMPSRRWLLAANWIRGIASTSLCHCHLKMFQPVRRQPRQTSKI